MNKFLIDYQGYHPELFPSAYFVGKTETFGTGGHPVIHLKFVIATITFSHAGGSDQADLCLIKD